MSRTLTFTTSQNPNQSSQAYPSSQSPHQSDTTMASIHQLVLDLSNPDCKEKALVQLAKKREILQDLAPLMWHTFGTIASLLQEVVSVYPYLPPSNVSGIQSTRVCNALALLQCVATHPDTKILFLNAHIPLYLYPFLNAATKEKPLEYLRLTSLGVIGSLVKVDDAQVIGFLIRTEIVPLCLRAMEYGSQLSKEVATFIVQKVVLDEVGLWYICGTMQRFNAVIQVLMATLETEQPSPRLLKHLIRCCLRFCDSPLACEALQEHLPSLLSMNFDKCFHEDPPSFGRLQELMLKVCGKFEPMPSQGGLLPIMGYTAS